VASGVTPGVLGQFGEARAQTLILGLDGAGRIVDHDRQAVGLLSSAHRSGSPRRPALTGAELRLLPLLSTHLSFPEIAAELFVSRNTIKTQSVSIYRKPGASSRSQAVARARALGLMEGSAGLLTFSG
jgi:LuxR family transcriptional regulator, maltose regulon positive regulatory protein